VVKKKHSSDLPKIYGAELVYGMVGRKMPFLGCEMILQRPMLFLTDFIRYIIDQPPFFGCIDAFTAIV
jgi:hypothetical protein